MNSASDTLAWLCSSTRSASGRGIRRALRLPPVFPIGGQQTDLVERRQGIGDFGFQRNTAMIHSIDKPRAAREAQRRPGTDAHGLAEMATAAEEVGAEIGIDQA